MSDLVCATYFVVIKGMISPAPLKLWVKPKSWGGVPFKSIDGKIYTLMSCSVRPVGYVIPYEVFIKDEYIS